MQSKAKQTFKFKFDMADYAFLALIMTKYDLKLAEVREDLVPEQIEEEDFWNNYFY